MLVLPQFPLGSVLFPTMALPLHIFEPRYRSLVADVLKEDKTFGVVLIERGFEVGGNDSRFSYGTLARIVEAEQLRDGRWNVLAVGTRRFRVTTWFEGAPYPKADVVFVDEPTNTVDKDDYTEVIAKFGRLMAIASEAGIDVGCTPLELDDLEVASYQMSAMAPLNMLDKYQLLSAESTAKRMGLLDSHLEVALDTMQFRLRSDTTFE